MGSILVCLAGTPASVAVEADARVTVSVTEIARSVSGLSELPLSFLRARLSVAVCVNLQFIIIKR